MIGNPLAIRKIAELLKNNPELGVVIKPGDKSVNQHTERNLLENLQELLVNEGLIIWMFPQSGGMIVELDFYKESNDG